MRESPGKAAARAYLYERILPAWIPHEARRSSAAVLLLGPVDPGGTPRELPYLDALGVRRDRIWSCENHLDTYRAQLAWNDAQYEAARVSLHYGDVAEFLRYQLLSDARFSFLHLDVEGSLRTQIDAALSPTLLFCWRNPSTIVITAASVGRDRAILLEGLASLGLFHRIAPDATEAFLARALAQYDAVLWIQSPLQMVLREAFWLRCILEHAIQTTLIVSDVRSKPLARALGWTAQTWQALLQERRRTNVTLTQLRTVARSAGMRELPTLRKGIVPCAIRRIVYEAAPPWRQLCHAVRFERTEGVLSLSTWLELAFECLLRQSLVAIDEDGVIQEHEARARLSLSDRTILWEGSVESTFQPRQLSPAYR